MLASSQSFAASNYEVNVDAIYFPDDRLISKRQVNKNLNLVRKQDRIVENRYTAASPLQQQQRQQLNQQPTTLNRNPTQIPQSQLIPSSYQPPQSYNYDSITDFVWSTFKVAKSNLFYCSNVMRTNFV